MNRGDTTSAAVLEQLRRRSADPQRRILFTGATVVTMDPRLGVLAPADLLVEGETILAVGPDLDRDGAVVVDAAGTILAPGFVDTHRHAWETQLRRIMPDVDDLGGYDLVSFDPWGVGESAGVQCLDDKAMDAWLAQDSTPDDAAEEKALTVGGSVYARACESNSGGVLEYVGTQEAARDLDLMRQVLGDEKLNYFGISYGTQLGGVYAHLFPKNVGRTVFDAVVDPTEDFAAGLLGQTEGFEGALQNFLEDCVKQDECFFEGKDPARGEKEITDLLESLDAKPLPAEDEDRVLTQAQAGMGILSALYSQESWSWLSAALEDAQKGEGGGLLWLSDLYAERDINGVYSNSGPANTAVNCADSKDRFTVEDVRRQLPEFRKVSPVFGEMTAWMLLACTDWPVDGHASTVDVKADGAGPVLVIGNTGDPATPYEGAKKMADALGEGVGVHLTVEGEGHGTYGVNKCLTKIVDKYLLDGTVPENDTVCS
ncbi:alpha/beta hydrolase [Streptomyces sp. P9-A2]|uniref:alpha/beta hydrolase n=1 Tax=Streptomyces sp. P9-A2 TaxID=3072284 RepID=UPI002FCA4F7E